MTSFLDLPVDMIRVICSVEMMRHESMAQRIVAGFILRCTCRALRQAVDYHAKDYHSLAKVPYHESYDLGWRGIPWHRLDEMVFELARMGLVDRRLLIPLNQYRRAEYRFVLNLGVKEHSNRPWEKSLLRGIYLWSRDVYPLWVIEGLCVGGREDMITARHLVTLRKDWIWDNYLLQLAARYDCPKLYFWRGFQEHERWKGGTLSPAYYDINGSECYKHKTSLYLYGARRCFDALLASCTPAVRHKQLIIIRANIRNMLRVLNGRPATKDRLTDLLHHLDGRFKAKRKREDDDGTATKRARKET